MCHLTIFYSRKHCLIHLSICFQVEEHTLWFQYYPCDPNLAHFYCKITDGKKHLVLCG